LANRWISSSDRWRGVPHVLHITPKSVRVCNYGTDGRSQGNAGAQGGRAETMRGGKIQHGSWRTYA
jgi:hypothetical protein